MKERRVHTELLHSCYLFQLFFRLNSGYARYHIVSWSPEPRYRDGCSRKGVKRTLGCTAGLTLTLVCVAAAGLLVVIQ